MQKSLYEYAQLCDESNIVLSVTEDDAKKSPSEKYTMVKDAIKEVEQLFQVPVEFQEHSVHVLKRTSAIVRWALEPQGPNATATLYYGPTDCLTFVSRDLHGTEKKGASAGFYTADRTWAHQTIPMPAQDAA